MEGWEEEWNGWNENGMEWNGMEWTVEEMEGSGGVWRVEGSGMNDQVKDNL